MERISRFAENLLNTNFELIVLDFGETVDFFKQKILNVKIPEANRSISS